MTGKLNFRGYLISRFYPTREIRENLMHAKNTCFTVRCILHHSYPILNTLLQQVQLLKASTRPCKIKT